LLKTGNAFEPTGIRGDRLRHGRQLSSLPFSGRTFRRLHDQLLPALQLQSSPARPLLPLELVQDEAEQGLVQEVPRRARQQAGRLDCHQLVILPEYYTSAEKIPVLKFIH
jgi:hypothetical protein